MADLQAGAGALAIAIEQVYDQPQLLVEKDAVLDKLITETGRAIAVSAHLFRLTFKDSLPGQMAAVYLDNPGVNFPTPGSSSWQNGSLAPVAWSVPIGWTKLVELTSKPGLTVVQMVSEQMADTIDVMAQRRDMMIAAGDGTGFLGNITAVDAVNFILTFNSNDYGASLILKGQTFDIYNGLNLVGSATCTAVQNTIGNTQTVNCSSLPAGVAAGNVARVSQLTSGSPTFVYGIPYWNSNATVGLTAGLDRSVPSNNFIISNGINAAGSAVTLPLLRLPFNQIRSSLGVDAVKNGKLVIHTHPGQRAAYEGIAGQMATLPLDGGRANGFDGLFNGDLTVGGVRIVESNHAHRQRWDFLNTERWGKIKWGDPPFWFTSEGRKVFQQVGTNGQITAGAASYMIDTVNYFVDNPKAQAAIYNAKQPTGY